MCLSFSKANVATTKPITVIQRPRPTECAISSNTQRILGRTMSRVQNVSKCMLSKYTLHKWIHSDKQFLPLTVSLSLSLCVCQYYPKRKCNEYQELFDCVVFRLLSSLFIFIFFFFCFSIVSCINFANSILTDQRHPQTTTTKSTQNGNNANPFFRLHKLFRDSYHFTIGGCRWLVLVQIVFE